MSAYYNEIEPAAAHVLRCLIKDGVIAPGDVDDRSITDVRPEDLQGYEQCHFFAGGGLWSVALRLAGWEDARPIWTGSCPCQPFSVAGKGAGKDDARHLWPDFFRLIEACRPAVVMGEQVAGAAGEDWFDGVAADLERVDYAARAVDIPACAVDAPHIRQRLYWTALENTSDDRTGRVICETENKRRKAMDAGAESLRRKDGTRLSSRANPFDYRCLADSNGGHGFWWSGPLQVGWNAIEGKVAEGGDGERTKWRVKPGLSLLANGIPGRVELLRIAGNAIVAPLAAEVIKALMETL